MKMHGNETAIVFNFREIFKIGKYRLYKVKLRRRERYFLVDHHMMYGYQNNLKRITNNFFVCIGASDR